MSLSKKIRSLFPPRARVEPQLRIVRRTRIPGGERWLIGYQTAPRERVSAFLLVPNTGGDRVPAILASHQHNGEFGVGKSETAGLGGDPEMAYGLELFQRGYVVLCPDHLGFEDRQQKAAQNRFPRAGKSYEHFLFADEILKGGSLAARYLFDLQQALDVLEQLSFVDAGRLGAIGHSLGGQTAVWLAAMDRRIHVAFSSCGFGTLRSIQRRQIPHNCAMYLPGLMRVGDMDDVITSIAPRAFGMCHGAADANFPVSGVRQIHARAKRSFPKEQLFQRIFPGGHAFPPRLRAQAYIFMDHHLGIRANRV